MLKPYLIVALFALLWSTGCLAESLHIRVLDVGEGQAVLLHKNQQGILIDTGHAGKTASVLRRMQALGIERLDYLFLTHLHPDHASGYFRVLEDFHQVKVRDNCHPVEKRGIPDMIRWVAEALQFHGQRQCVKSGDSIEWGRTDIHVLWPLREPAPKAGLNHASLVLEVTHAGKRLLLMGDAGRLAEQELLQGSMLQPVDILVVGHHGAADASSEEFVGKINPRISAISINKHNIRGYPSPAVIRRLQNHGSKVFTTYEHGELHFVFDE